jgi:hypothetical protein
MIKSISVNIGVQSKSDQKITVDHIIKNNALRSSTISFSLPVGLNNKWSEK